MFKEVEGLFETAKNDQVLLTKNRGLVKKIIGIVSKVPDVVQKTCSKTNIIKGFVLCGDLSVSKDGKKVIPISNLNSIMERCDVNWDEDYITYSPEGDEINHGPLRDYFKSLIPEALQASKDYGEIPESFNDSRLPLHQTPSGDDYLRTSGPLAYSVRRAMIVHHKSHRDLLDEKTQEAKIRSTDKKRRTINKCKAYFEDNHACEKKIRKRRTARPKLSGTFIFQGLSYHVQYSRHLSPLPVWQ